MAAALVVAFFLGTFAIVGGALLVASKKVQGPHPQEASALLSAPPSILKVEVLSTISAWSWLLSKFAFAERLRALLAEAELPWSVGRLTAMMMLSGALVLGFVINVSWMPFWAAASLTLLAVAAPYFRVLHCRRRRLERIEAQLPDALDYLARALRAGHPFSLALEMLGSEKSPPLSTEIRRAVEERKLGSSWEDVFEGLCRRVPVQEMGVFSAAALLQTRTGGRLNDVLSRLAENMREAAALRGEVRAISAHGRLSGVILTLMPVVVVAIMSVVNPGYLGVLLRHPYGEHLIGAAVAALVSAHLIIRRMVAVRI